MSRSSMRWAVLVALASLACACGDERAPEPPETAAAPEVTGEMREQAEDGIPSWAKVGLEQILEASRYGVAVAFENHLGMRFVLIPAGTFVMGSPPHEKDRDWDEVQRTVRHPRPFYLQTTETTNALFRRWKPSHDSDLTPWGFTLNGDEQPVHACFDEAVRFAEWVSKGDGARAYRLATEEEWEYACRAGSRGRYYWGGSLAVAYRYENHAGYLREGGRDERGCPLSDKDGFRTTAPVGSFRPNPWGLYDMLGNMDEWCLGFYSEPPWEARRVRLLMSLPTYWNAEDTRVVRSSFCLATLDRLRCASRDGLDHRRRLSVSGIRLVSPLPEDIEPLPPSR